MTRQEKAQTIDDLVEKFSAKTNFYVADASGLTVKQINGFRRLCFEQGVEYKVAKNTLIQKALERLDEDFSLLNDQVLKGVTGILFADESVSGPAKVLKQFRKTDRPGRPLLKGAYIESDFYIGDDQLESLSQLKSQTELLGEIINLLQSPIKRVITALQSGESKLAGVVKTLSEREQ